MKWLLVTTNPTPFVPGSAHPNGAGWNVGDIFALVGTQQLVREADPDAEIELVNMDLASSFVPERTFDRAIFAGRPMFWRDAPKHPLWVHLLDDWLCRDPRKVLALGVGDVFPIGELVGASGTELAEQIIAARRRCWRVILRQSVAGAEEDCAVCPGAWALLDRPELPTERLCNLMPGGAHYPRFDEREATRWKELEPKIAETLISEGFTFVAHTIQEAVLADRLGWRANRIFLATSVNDYLTIYARARSYIGNRMHGAIVLGGRPAVATAIGWDSRLRAVAHAGHRGLTPNELSASFDFRALCRLEPKRSANYRVDWIRGERQRMLELVKDFAS